jgi:tetratricopeptide (TPR) repeat protein
LIATERRRWEEATTNYSKAIEFDPDYEKSCLNRGTLRHSQGNLDGAKADFDKAIELVPTYARAYMERGYLRFHQRDLAGAEHRTHGKLSSSIPKTMPPTTLWVWSCEIRVK